MSAVSTMKTTGKMNAIAAAMSRLWSAIVTSRRRRRTARGTSRGGAGGADGAATGTAGECVLTSAPRPCVVHPASRVAHDQQRDREGDDEQQHRHRRRVAHVEEAEALLEEQHG